MGISLSDPNPYPPMPNKTLETQIRTHVDSFVQEIEGLLRQAALETVAEALGGVAAPARRGPGRPPKNAARRTTATKKTAGRKKAGKRVRRSSEGVDAIGARVLAHVRANPRCSVGDIGDALGLSTKDLQLPIKKLVGEKKLRTEGQKRGTRYFAGGRGGGAARKKATKKKGKRRAAKKGRRKTTKGTTANKALAA